MPDIASFIWGVADLIRDSFKRGKYQDVILPFTVLRRIDCVLKPKRKAVFSKYQTFRESLSEDKLAKVLQQASGFAFYNVSNYDFESLLADGDNLEANLSSYIQGFSRNMREVIVRFDFLNTISKLEEAGLLFKVMERFNQIDLHPDVLDNHAMGSVFEELIRKFNEATNENPGEHFTPRDVVRLMARLLLEPDREKLQQAGKICEICDPCCGTGGMLTITRDLAEEMGLGARFYFYGQEVNPETFAICKSDLFMQSTDGRDAENIKFGSTLAEDQHEGKVFDYLIANPPYGKDWKGDQAAVKKEAAREGSRFSPGLPRINDGQLLFLLHMAHHIRPAYRGGGRLAVIMNGSPLFTGDAGSGESEIRGFLLEQDLVEAIVALPEQLFYNTGIATYVWILSSKKAGTPREGKVQLIHASGEAFWQPMRKSLGDKRRELSNAQIEQIVALYTAFEENENSKIFDRDAFGYHKITVERPLRLKFRADETHLALLREHKAFAGLAVSKKKNPGQQKVEEEAGRLLQESILRALGTLPDAWIMDRAVFEKQLKEALKQRKLTLKAPVKKAILECLGERDETAAICRNSKGEAEPDPELRDTENVPLTEDIEAYFEREVLPHVPDAWIDWSKEKKGWEIPFSRYFYEYIPIRPLGEIRDEIRSLDREISTLVRKALF
ncbi:type I restriction-modification system subunit M [Acanthopleuribacter pedis]|uniref:site-specific DNA-methyltransferase (adenine-specific) n=1 Tax=Acanthopleuribacter pedis TaxID=442870 RepID=A0A8J7Q8E6_9BACT|nr:class I SAM-dependent DNA methyltransferase [Acanthopleuribacter pedis]MBO1320371.1 SAM-dependent DNA methyltransferase [Acanthopleuribacter pedis]